MIANLRLTEGVVLPSGSEQRVGAIVGARETTLVLNNLGETVADNETVLLGTATEGNGTLWNFLLFPGLDVGAVYNGDHTRTDALKHAHPLRRKAEKEKVGACCA